MCVGIYLYKKAASESHLRQQQARQLPQIGPVIHVGHDQNGLVLSQLGALDEEAGLQDRHPYRLQVGQDGRQRAADSRMEVQVAPSVGEVNVEGVREVRLENLAEDNRS